METSRVPGGEPQSSGGTGQEQKPDQKPNDTVSFESHKKLLDEKKAMQAKLAAFEAKEREQAEKNGEFQKLYESEKAGAEKLAQEAREKEARFALSSVSAQLKAEAAKAGCKRLDALEKLVDLNELKGKIGSDYSVDPAALKAFVEKAAKEHDYLFAKEAPSIRDMPPSSGKPPESKSFADEIKTAKTQKEFDAIMKKHGKI